jgi:hypothetical protein
MAEITGKRLENVAQKKLTSLGLTCIHGLRQARLQELDPSGPHAPGDHLELDFLVPHGNICVVGEVDGRGTPDSVRDKFDRFRRHFALLKRLQFGERFWREIGVPRRSLRVFRNVDDLRAIYIAARVQRFDVSLPQETGILTLYQADWKVLRSYADAIGRYGRPYILSLPERA